MQITPSHDLLHALSASASPKPTRPAAAAITADPVRPGREVTPPREPGALDRPAAPPRPGARVDILV